MAELQPNVHWLEAVIANGGTVKLERGGKEYAVTVEPYDPEVHGE